MTLVYILLIICKSAVVQPTDSSCASTSFQNKNIFSGIGVIFNCKDRKIALPVRSYTHISAFKAEQADSILLASIRTKRREENVRYYWNYDRQYLGFIDISGKEYVYVQLVERHKAMRLGKRKEYDAWLKQGLITAFVEPGKEFLQWYYVDIKNKKVEVH